jgi:hypothetical protein
VCNKTRKSFGELIDHFIIGSNETNLIADADGDLRIVGEKGKKKHKKKVADYRGLITMYRTGVAAGYNGPIVFLLKGKKRKSGINKKFLKQESCVLGLTICMTENAYMTEDAWEEMTPSLVKGYQDMPVVRDNPQWWMIEMSDGFGAHLTNLNALKQCADALILSIKEEGGSSSYNQEYDKHVAKSDKLHQRRVLTFMQSLKNRSRNLIDQWDLIHCGVAAVRYTGRNPGVRISSFVSVNLHPMRMISFADW